MSLNKWSFIMKKILAILAIFVTLTMVTNAQKIKLSVGPEIAIPLGTFGDAANLGIGATVRAEYTAAPNINLMFTTGYVSWGGKDIDLGFFGTIKTDYSNIPLLAGAKYYLNPSVYGMAELGLNMFSVSVGGASTSETKFGGSVGAGYETALTPTLSLDINAKYAFVADDLNHIGARVGLKFGL